MNLDKIKSIVITDKEGKTIFEVNEKEYMCAEGYEMKVTSKWIDTKTFDVVNDEVEFNRRIEEDLKQRVEEMERYNNNPDYRGPSPWGRFRR